MKISTAVIILPFLVLWITVQLSSASQICNQGMVGRRKCTKVIGYEDYQWVTCVGKQYLEVKSKGMKMIYINSLKISCVLIVPK